MPPKKYIQRKRARENKRRMLVRDEKKIARDEVKRVEKVWAQEYATELEAASKEGEKRLVERFGKSTTDRGLEQQAEHSSDDKNWKAFHIARILGPARLRKISVIDGEWSPPKKFKPIVRKTKRKKGDTGPDRLVSDPIQPRLFGYYDGHNYRRYPDLAELVRGELTNANKGRWIYAHNGGKADFLFLVREMFRAGGVLSDSRYQVKHAMAGSRILFVQISKGGHVKMRSKETGEVFLDDDGEPLKRWRVKATWTFCDSMAIFQMPLAAIGKSIKKKKGEAPKTTAYLRERFGKEDLEELGQEDKKDFYREAPLDVLEEYNRVDCEILWNALHGYQRTILKLGGSLYQTGASTALNLFRRAYLRSDIRTDPKTNDVVEYGDAYIASRVEPLRRYMGGSGGRRPKFGRRWRSKSRPAGYSHDINSSFATSMLRPLPGALEDEAGGVGVKEFVARFNLDERKLHKNPVLMADLDIEVPVVSPVNKRRSFVPPLPIRARKTGHIFFPHGSWRALFTTPDIELLLQYGGRIKTVHRVWAFTPFTDHSDYATGIYDLRKAARAAGSTEEVFYKLLLNALYGKYAESEVKEAFIFRPTAQQWEDFQATEKSHPDPFGGEDIVEQIGGLRQIHEELCVHESVERLPHRHSILSAYITADGRARLTRWLWAAEEKGRVFYGDTDSIRNTTKLPTGNELGQLKAEAIIESADFRQPKLYRMRGWEVDGDWSKVKKAVDTKKAKGFRALTSDEYESLVAGHKIEQQRMMSLRETLQYLADNPRPSAETPDADVAALYLPRELQFPKEALEAEIPKRKPLAHGETRPWTVDELRAQGMDVRPHAEAAAEAEPRYRVVRGLAAPAEAPRLRPGMKPMGTSGGA